jgi:hypothetical protein
MYVDMRSGVDIRWMNGINGDNGVVGTNKLGVPTIHD